jgi:hypothetical protein
MGEPQRLLHIKVHKTREDDHRDHFLHDLELSQIEVARADAIGGDLKAILEKRNAPADDYDQPERAVLHRLQMPVPCKRHEDV